MARLKSVYERIIRWGSPQKREMWRLAHLPRYQPTTTALLGVPLRVVDGQSFYWAYKAIFEREVYDFVARDEAPCIIDCGANVGLSTIYFKRRFPQSRVVAFEPDPALFAALEHNVTTAVGTAGVELINAAVWNSQHANLPFFAEGADGGRLTSRPQNGTTIEVVTERLRDYLNARVGLLKLDIEGAELEVLRDCADRLQQVDHLFTEYHSFCDNAQHLDELLSILRKSGFRVYVENDHARGSPFVDRLEVLGMDLLVNVFAYREKGPSSDS